MALQLRPVQLRQVHHQLPACIRPGLGASALALSLAAFGRVSSPPARCLCLSRAYSPPAASERRPVLLYGRQKKSPQLSSPFTIIMEVYR